MSEDNILELTQNAELLQLISSTVVSLDLKVNLQMKHMMGIYLSFFFVFFLKLTVCFHVDRGRGWRWL